MEPSTFLKSQAKMNGGAGSRRHGDVSMFSWINPAGPGHGLSEVCRPFLTVNTSSQAFQVHHPGELLTSQWSWHSESQVLVGILGAITLGCLGLSPKRPMWFQWAAFGYLWLAEPLFLGACSALTEFSECPLPMLLHSTTHFHCLHHASRQKENN